nr:hypothetical protein Iba_chr13bCG13090 [Ipomoea batatas]
MAPRSRAAAYEGGGASWRTGHLRHPLPFGQAAAAAVGVSGSLFSVRCASRVPAAFLLAPSPFEQRACRRHGEAAATMELGGEERQQPPPTVFILLSSAVHGAWRWCCHEGLGKQQQRRGSTETSADRRHSPISDERRDQWRQPAPTGMTAETRLPASGDETPCGGELGGPAAEAISVEGDKDEALLQRAWHAAVNASPIFPVAYDSDDAPSVLPRRLSRAG